MKVYLISSTINKITTYKIGRTSRNTTERLAELRTGNAGEMRVVCEYECSCSANLIEKALHSLYSHKRLSGEWFKDTIEISDFLKSCESIDKSIKKLKEYDNPFV
jgi:hypothetical protein